MLRRLAAAAVSVVVACAVFAGTRAPVASAATDGLSYANVTTFTVDPAQGLVHVRADLTLTNTLSDSNDGYIIRRPYFRGVAMPMPARAVNEAAVNGSGRGLGVSRRAVPGVDSFVLLDVDFGSRLFSRQTQHVAVTYDIAGLPPRSPDPSRVNGAYAAFDAYGVGDEGKVTVRVVVPKGFQVDTLGDTATKTIENGNTVYTATDIENPAEFDIFISARNDDALASHDVTTADGVKFDLRTWPGDTKWQKFVTTQIQKGLPELSDLIGQDWPIDGTVQVREAYTPYLYGYAGWFSAADKELEVGEDLDQEVVLHELSHAWFSENWFSERWLNEGFAQVYSNKAVDVLGGKPLTPHPIRDTEAGKVLLDDWENPVITAGADATEDYGYNASFFVLRDIVNELGDDAMRRVFDAVANETTAYVGDLPAEKVTGTTNWQRFLDLVEREGSKKARALIEQYVMGPGEADELKAREDARTKYDALEQHGDEWAPPVAVRQRMAAWTFIAATKSIDAAEAVLTLRDTLDERAATLHATYPDHFATDYEKVDDDFTKVSDALQEQIDTGDRVIAAVNAEAKDDGFLATIGLWGTDLPKGVAAATAAFEKGDHTAARAEADEVMRVVAKADDVGTKRLALTIGAFLLFVLLVVLVVVLVRRRRRRRRQATEATSTEETSIDAEIETASDADAATEPEDEVPEPSAQDDPSPT